MEVQELVVMPEAVTSEASRRRGRRPDMVDLSNPTEPTAPGSFIRTMDHQARQEKRRKHHQHMLTELSGNFEVASENGLPGCDS